MSIQFSPAQVGAVEARRVNGLRVCDPNVFEGAPSPGAFCFLRIRPPTFFSLRFYCPCGCMAEGNVLVQAGKRPEGGFFWDGHFTRPTIGPLIRFPNHAALRLDLGVWQILDPATPASPPL